MSFATFDLLVYPRFSTRFQVNWPFGSGEEPKKYFQDSIHGGDLRFSIETILAIFDLRVNLMLPTKIQVSWRFGSGEEAKNRFSKWWPRRPP